MSKPLWLCWSLCVCARLGILGATASALAEQPPRQQGQQTSSPSSSEKRGTPQPEPPKLSSKQASLHQTLWTKLWEPKTAKITPSRLRFHSGLCTQLWRDVLQDVGRQHFLLRKMASFLCDPKEWRRCMQKRPRNQKQSCHSGQKQQQWSACFRLERRLHVVTERLTNHKQEGQKAKCPWQLHIPVQFQRIHFAPHPKLSDVEKVR